MSIIERAINKLDGNEEPVVTEVPENKTEKKDPGSKPKQSAEGAVPAVDTPVDSPVGVKDGDVGVIAQLQKPSFVNVDFAGI